MIRKIFAFLCAVSFTFSDEIPYDQIVFGGEPTAIIDGCVHAITGDYFIDETDWVVNGHEPIPIRRRYLSSDAGNLKFGGWEFFFHHLIATRVCTDVKDEPMPSNDGIEHTHLSTLTTFTSQKSMVLLSSMEPKS